MTSEANELTILKQKMDESGLPRDVALKVDIQLTRLSRLTGSEYTAEADGIARWIACLVDLPWNKRAADRLDLTVAREILDKNHHGLNDIKERILEYLAVLKLKQVTSDKLQVTSHSQTSRAPILLLVGLAGTGKTSLAYSIAEAMDRPLVRIPFGGLGSARDLRGQSRLHDEAEPGQIIKAMTVAAVKNPVILLDELDRVADATRADVMGVLVELLDPTQNRAFLDHYLDVPFDLSEVMFIATANNTGNIATAVLDRLEPLSLPTYNDQDKIAIASGFLLPQAISEAGLPEGSLAIDTDVWEQIVRPLGYDAGIRTLQRTISGVVRKVAKQIVMGEKQVVHLTKDNVREYIERW